MLLKIIPNRLEDYSSSKHKKIDPEDRDRIFSIAALGIVDNSYSLYMVFQVGGVFLKSFAPFVHSL